MKKFRGLFLLLFFVGLFLVGCDNEPENNLSNDNSIFLTVIGDEIVQNNSVTITESKWEEWLESDLKQLTQYKIDSKAYLQVIINEVDKTITYLVKAENGEENRVVINVNIASSDTSFTLTSVFGIEVSNNEIVVTSAKWEELTEENFLENSVYTLADAAKIKLTLDKDRKELNVKVTAEDGTKGEYNYEILIKEIIEETNLSFGLTTNGSTATSYWHAEYTDNGINIAVDVLDDNIISSNSDFGYNDNIEFIIGLRSKEHSLSVANDYKILVDCVGNFSVQKAVNTTGFANYSDYAYGREFRALSNKVEYVEGSGYRVEVFISYSFLGVTSSVGRGNLTISPVMRNSPSATANEGWKSCDQLGNVWARSYTYIGIEENGEFVNNVEKYYSNVDYLFIGDSWIDVWFWSGFDTDFGDLNAINIGIGGTKGEDWLARLQQIKSFNPKNLVFRIGTNDINGGQSGSSNAEEIIGLFELFHANLPQMHIYFLSIDPCIGHLHNWTNNQIPTANRMIEEAAESLDYVTYVDFTNKLLDENGNVIKSMFRADTCHLSTMGYATYTKVMKEAMGLPYTEGAVFGDSGKFSHTLGFSSENGNTTHNTGFHEQHTYFKDFQETEFYAEFEITALGVYNADQWPKFGFKLDNGNLSMCLYVDGFASLTGPNVGIVWRRDQGDYNWGEIKSKENVAYNYSNGSYIKLGVLRSGGSLYYYVNDVLAIQMDDLFLDTETVVGAFAFNTEVKIKNASITTDQTVITEKLS